VWDTFLAHSNHHPITIRAIIHHPHLLTFDRPALLGVAYVSKAAEQVQVFTGFLLYVCNVVNKRAERLCMGFEVSTGMLTLAMISKRFSVLSPLTGLRGRNGGLSLKCCWRAFWAIGVKIVSLKSTLSTFWVIWVG
jgi:hypothetical protein